MVSKETPNADGQTDLSLPTEPSSRSQKVAAPRERDKFLNYSRQLLTLSQRF